jgi:hypothetical protein
MAWSMQLMTFLNSHDLVGHDLVGFIDDTIKAPKETI